MISTSREGEDGFAISMTRRAMPSSSSSKLTTAQHVDTAIQS